MELNPKAITKAQSRLRTAHKAVADLERCEDVQSFSDTWYTFLTAAKNIYTSLEQGAKTSPQNAQWFGGVKAKRRADPLLQYLFQARDDDEHGLDPVINQEPSSLSIGVPGDGYSSHVRVTGDIGPGKSLKVQSLDGKPVLIDFKPERVVLATVTGRGDVKYAPPETHLGEALQDNLPITVARKALDYFASLLAEAESRS